MNFKKGFFALLLSICTNCFAIDISVINDFWNNSITFKDDEIDYWQTPQETWDKKTGDCEDFAIAKYFHLLAKDIDASRLSLAWVLLNPLYYPELVKNYNPKPISHMVLIYEDEHSKKWVLDNISKEIVLLEKREDFLTIIAEFKKNEINYYVKTQPILNEKWQEIISQYDKNLDFIKNNF